MDRERVYEIENKSENSGGSGGGTNLKKITSQGMMMSLYKGCRRISVVVDVDDDDDDDL